MLENDINYLFNEVSLYTKEKFDVFELKNGKYEYNQKEFFKFLYYIGVQQEKLISYCHVCKKEFPFDITKKLFQFTSNFRGEKTYMSITNKKSGIDVGQIDLYNGMIIGVQPPYTQEELANNSIWYIEYFFTCTNNHNHKYMLMISIELKDGTFIVRKIGQNPSMLTIKGFDFDKYKKQLEELNAYEDYKKADLSNADHFYVGAYAYLRRIFEKMVNKYLFGKELEDNHMDTKINAIKDKFDPRIQKLLKNLYEILSVSIHELDEEQSKEYYVYLKTIIDMQLEYIKTESDKESQSKSLESILDKIKSGIKLGGKK